MINATHDDPEKFIGQLINIFSRVPLIYEQNESDVSRYDDECNDLTHAIELSNFSGVQGYKLAKELQNNRKSRREVKEHNFMLKPLYELVKKNQHLLGELRKCHSEINKLADIQKNRKYYPRANSTIVEEAIKKANRKNDS